MQPKSFNHGASRGNVNACDASYTYDHLERLTEVEETDGWDLGVLPTWVDPLREFTKKKKERKLADKDWAKYGRPAPRRRGHAMKAGKMSSAYPATSRGISTLGTPSASPEEKEFLASKRVSPKSRSSSITRAPTQLERSSTLNDDSESTDSDIEAYPGNIVSNFFNTIHDFYVESTDSSPSSSSSKLVTKHFSRDFSGISGKRNLKSIGKKSPNFKTEGIPESFRLRGRPLVSSRWPSTQLTNSSPLVKSILSPKNEDSIESRYGKTNIVTCEPSRNGKVASSENGTPQNCDISVALGKNLSFQSIAASRSAARSGG